MNIFVYSVLHVWPTAKKSNIWINSLTRENFCVKQAVAQCVKLIVNDDQRDATILGCLFIS